MEWWDGKSREVAGRRGKAGSLAAHNPECAGEGDNGALDARDSLPCDAVFYSPAHRGSLEVSAPPSFSEQARKGIRDALRHPG